MHRLSFDKGVPTRRGYQIDRVSRRRGIDQPREWQRSRERGGFAVTQPAAKNGACRNCATAIANPRRESTINVLRASCCSASWRPAFTRFSVYRGEKEIAHFRCRKPLFSQLTDVGIVTGKRRAAMSKIKHQ
jgi:hypothetical protein